MPEFLLSRSLDGGVATGVDAVCVYRKDSTTPAFDREKVYHEIVNQTSGFTKMEPYKLDRNSLYVNGKSPGTLKNALVWSR